MTHLLIIRHLIAEYIITSRSTSCNIISPFVSSTTTRGAFVVNHQEDIFIRPSKSKKNSLQQTAKSDAGSWIATVRKQSLKRKESGRFFYTLETAAAATASNEREKGDIKFNLWFLYTQPLCATQLLNWYDKLFLFREVEIFIGWLAHTYNPELVLFTVGIVERNYKERVCSFLRSDRPSLYIIGNKIYERSTRLRRRWYNIYEY